MGKIWQVLVVIAFIALGAIQVVDNRPLATRLFETLVELLRR